MCKWKCQSRSDEMWQARHFGWCLGLDGRGRRWDLKRGSYTESERASIIFLFLFGKPLFTFRLLSFLSAGFYVLLYLTLKRRDITTSFFSSYFAFEKVITCLPYLALNMVSLSCLSWNGNVICAGRRILCGLDSNRYLSRISSFLFLVFHAMQTKFIRG